MNAPFARLVKTYRDRIAAAIVDLINDGHVKPEMSLKDFVGYLRGPQVWEEPKPDLKTMAEILKEPHAQPDVVQDEDIL